MKTLSVIVFLAITLPGIGQGINCDHEYTASNNIIDGEDILPGDTVCLMGGSWNYILLRNIHGTEENPIVVINSNGVVLINSNSFYGIKLENCSHVILSGTGNDFFTYGIIIASVSHANGAGLTLDAKSTNIELENIEISNVNIGGIYAKTEPDFEGDCTFAAVRDSFTMYNTIIHDCYLHDIGDEGMYIGSSKYMGQTIYNCNDTVVLPAVLKGVKVYNNRLENIGWDGIQVSSAVEDCEIYNNIIINDSYEEELYQMSGIIVGGGGNCDCYNNKIIKGKGDGIDYLGLGGNRIFNNLIVNPGKTYHPNDPPLEYQKHGIWVGNISTESNKELYIYNNTIVNPRTFGIKLANSDITEYYVQNNILLNPGGYPDVGEDAYINLYSPGITLNQSHNYKNTDTSTAKFVYPLAPAYNYDLHYYSPAVNTGKNMAFQGLTYDIENRIRPFDIDYDIAAYECQDSTLFAIGEYKPKNILSHVIQPNPFSTSPKLVLRLEEPENITFEIYNNISTLVDIIRLDEKGTGIISYDLNCEHLSPGLYYYRIKTSSGTYSGKMIKY